MTQCKDCKHWRFTPEQADENMHECARLDKESDESELVVECLGDIWDSCRVLTGPTFGCVLGEPIEAQKQGWKYEPL